MWYKNEMNDIEKQEILLVELFFFLLLCMGFCNKWMDNIKFKQVHTYIQII